MTQLAHNIYTDNAPQTDNYQFLEHSFPKLYRVSQESEQYYATDHACCLLKSRLFIELWSHEVADNLNINLALHGDLMDKIELLANSQQLPPYIIEALHNIRCQANRGVHIAKCSDDQWTGDATIAKTKLKRLMTDMFELAQYLAFKLNHQSDKEQPWHEPTETEFASQVYAALAGNKEATFALAQRASAQMELAKSDAEISNLEKKDHWQILQRDLSYWLDKAHRQGHQETWLMYANVYHKKQLMLPKGQTVDSCFKLALNSDNEGDVAFQYGCYLIDHAQATRGIELIIQASNKQHHQAIAYLQHKYYQKDQQQYLYWLNAGVEAGEKCSYTLDLAEKINQWQLDVDNEMLKKKAKTALISAQARQSPGVKYYSGYCDYHGYWGKQPKPQEGLNLMMAHYQDIPQFLYYEETLFNLVKNEKEYVDQAIKLANNALRINQTVAGKATIKFELAMLLWQKLQQQQQVKSPYGLKKLIREAANDGDFAAKQFVKSPKGKALLRDGGIMNIKTQHATPDRNKQKLAKKAARKAKRK